MLDEADLTNASLEKASLREATLRGAKLFGADLRGADLRQTDLLQADLRGAQHDRHTLWPEGFALGRAGTVLIQAGEPTLELTSLRPGSP